MWRTVGGRRIFIVNGQDLSTAMRESGKFNSNKKYEFTDENIEQIIHESVSKWDDDYAQLYITKISPKDFLELTSSQIHYDYIKMKQTERLDLEKIQNAKVVADMMYLDIDLGTGEVRGHEGRHRMSAFENEGYTEIDIVVFPYNYEKYNTKELNNFRITQQEGTERKKSTILKKLVPVSKRNVEKIRKRDY